LGTDIPDVNSTWLQQANIWSFIQRSFIWARALAVLLSSQVTFIIFALVFHAFSRAQFYFDVLKIISALSM
jgi:hypothetical protein